MTNRDSIGEVPESFTIDERKIWETCVNDWTHLTRNERPLLIEFVRTKYEHDKMRGVWENLGCPVVDTKVNGEKITHPLINKISQYKKTLHDFIKTLGGTPNAKNPKDSGLNDRKPIDERKDKGNDDFYNQPLEGGQRFGKGGPSKRPYAKN